MARPKGTKNFVWTQEGDVFTMQRDTLLSELEMFKAEIERLPKKERASENTLLRLRLFTTRVEALRLHAAERPGPVRP